MKDSEQDKFNYEKFGEYIIENYIKKGVSQEKLCSIFMTTAISIMEIAEMKEEMFEEALVEFRAGFKEFRKKRLAKKKSCE